MEYDFMISIENNSGWTSLWSCVAAILSAVSAAISCVISWKFRTSFKYQHKVEFYINMLNILKFERIQYFLVASYYDILQICINSGTRTIDELNEFNKQINILKEDLEKSFNISEILFGKNISNIKKLIKCFNEIKEINENVLRTHNYPSKQEKMNFEKCLDEINKSKSCVIDELNKYLM